MVNVSANNKRIAKNTVFLYLRMFISMLVSLYTSRVILQTLGVEDYGVYNIVGGVVAMFSFLNSTMSGATSRFLTFEMGKGDQQKVNDTFNASFWVHVVIAAVIFLLSETIGLWFLNCKMVIPAGREFAANVVFQLSILSTMMSITQVPYNATLLAHERMNVYAYVEMTNVFLKLAILYVLVVFDFDKLILFGILTFVVSTGIRWFYRFYGLRHYPECHVKFKWQAEIIKPMLSFSGWDLYGNISVMSQTTGVQMLLNIFFGTCVNAAAAVAGSVRTTVMTFAGNIISAIRPQIIKSYSAGDYKRVCGLINNGSNVIFFLLLFVSLPLIVNLDFILGLWLHEVPEWTPQFVVCMLIFNLFSSMVYLTGIGCHATGNIKRLSLINGTIYLLVVPLTYIAFRWMNATPIVPYVLNFCATAIGCILNAYTLHLYLPQFSTKIYLRNVFLRCLMVAAVAWEMVYLVSLGFKEEGWIRMLSLSAISCIVAGVLGWYFLCSSSIRVMIIGFVRKKLNWR